MKQPILHIGTENADQTVHLLASLRHILSKGRQIAVSPMASPEVALLVSRKGRGDVIMQHVRVADIPAAIPLWMVLNRGINSCMEDLEQK